MRMMVRVGYIETCCVHRSGRQVQCRGLALVLVELGAQQEIAIQGVRGTARDMVPEGP